MPKARRPSLRSEEERNDLVMRNLGLAGFVAKIWEKNPRSKHLGGYEDLRQEAIVGLIRCAELWDPAINNHFGGYAVRCLKLWLRRRVDESMFLHIAQGTLYRLLEENKNINPHLVPLHAADRKTNPDDSYVLEFEAIATAMRGLTPRAKEILNLRYGLGGDKPLTLQEVGQRMGVSRQYVAQVQEKAEAKIKKAINHHRKF